MTTSTTSVTQISLPGQTAAPEGPIDMIGMFVMHFAFRRDLNAFASAVTATPVQDRATWQALSDRWGKFSKALHDHHSLEDAQLWPRLEQAVRAASDDDAIAVVEAMEAEHAEIDPLLAAISEAFDQLAMAADTDTKRALEVRLAAGRDRLSHHMGHEEQSALPLVQRYLSRTDWEAMEKAAEKRPGDLPFFVPWVLHEMPSHALPRVRAFGGTALVMVGRIFRRSFERRERRAFRYLLTH